MPHCLFQPRGLLHRALIKTKKMARTQSGIFILLELKKEKMSMWKLAMIITLSMNMKPVGPISAA